MAIAFDLRQPTAKSRAGDMQSKAGHCLAVGSTVSSFVFILALVVGVL